LIMALVDRDLTVAIAVTLAMLLKLLTGVSLRRRGTTAPPAVAVREVVEQRVRFGNRFLIRRTKLTGELVTTDAPQGISSGPLPFAVRTRRR
jgi:hypothetical protein